MRILKTAPTLALVHAHPSFEQPAAPCVREIPNQRFIDEAAQQKRDSDVKQNSGLDRIPSFDRVLIATDFSSAAQAAFQTALEVCNLVHGSLLVLHVFEHSDVAVRASGGSLLEIQGLRQTCALQLGQLREQAAAAGIDCKTVLRDGVPASSILQALDDSEIDLAIIGTNAPHGFERLVFGSSAESVLRKANCPVLTVGPRVTRRAAETNTGPVVFATDFDYTTMQAIRYAAFFSNRNSAPLHCLNVLPRTLEAGAQTDVVPQIMSEALHQLAAEISAMIEPPTCATTFGSEVSYAVVDYARQQRARLIVLGVRQASLLASDVPEHITYRIITEANCPVLTMAYGSSTPAGQTPRRGSKHVPARSNAV
jgi:nucleotide-binding universal stress UspA family protein